jgi:hypothetical protein
MPQIILTGYRLHIPYGANGYGSWPRVFDVTLAYFTRMVVIGRTHLNRIVQSNGRGMSHFLTVCRRGDLFIHALRRSSDSSSWSH